MLYLVKSPKWTKYYKKDTYLTPNQCGYVTTIANAGFYEEEEAQDIIRRSGTGGAELVPVTKEILDKAHRQLRKIRKNIWEDREKEEKRHNAIVDDLEKKNIANDNSFDLLNQIAKQLDL